MVFRRFFLNSLVNKAFMFFAIVAIMFLLHVRDWSSAARSLPTPMSISKYTIINMEQHRNIVKAFFEPRKEWVTSSLGTYLFKLDGIQSDAFVRNIRAQDFFNVLIWKHWEWLKHRHTDGFRDHKYNPLYGCSVSNCNFSGNTSFASADAVVVHIQKGFLPKVTNRNPLQLWIFWVDESPINAFSLANKRPTDQELSGIFNWSMTYRSDSDVPIPYGRTVPLQYPRTDDVSIRTMKELVPFWRNKRRDILATILISHCNPSRMRFLLKLKEHLKIDIYGNCATDEYRKRRCSGLFYSDCKILSRYLFYIVMENSECRQYITEKSFHHAYEKGAIPVFVGAPLEECRNLLPPNSFLHIDDFNTVELLALEIQFISKHATKLMSYHAWRNNFEVVNEHGYFGMKSTQMCRVCEALNYNQRSQKVYGLSQMRSFLDPNIQCSFKNNRTY